MSEMPDWKVFKGPEGKEEEEFLDTIQWTILPGHIMNELMKLGDCADLLDKHDWIRIHDNGVIVYWPKNRADNATIYLAMKNIPIVGQRRETRSLYRLAHSPAAWLPIYDDYAAKGMYEFRRDYQT